MIPGRGRRHGCSCRPCARIRAGSAGAPIPSSTPNGEGAQRKWPAQPAGGGRRPTSHRGRRVGGGCYCRATAGAWPPGRGGLKGQRGCQVGGGAAAPPRKPLTRAQEGEGGRAPFPGRSISCEPRQVTPETPPAASGSTPAMSTELRVKDVHSSKLRMTNQSHVADMWLALSFAVLSFHNTVDNLLW